MAFITVLNGKVESTFFNGQGARVVEEFTKNDGTPGKAFYSAFFDRPHGLEVGDTGKFNGRYGSKVSANNPQFVDTTINGTRFEPNEDSGQDDEQPF